MVAVGAPDLPPPREVLALLRYRLGSVVVDLSMSSGEGVDRCLAGVAEYLEVQRQACGVPHWVVIDEAHRPLGPLGRRGPSRPFVHLDGRGYCLVTFRPGELDDETAAAVDVVVAVPDHETLDADAASMVASVAGVATESVVDLARRAPPGWAIMARRLETPLSFRVAERHAPHHRHWHKYAEGELSRDRRFWFRSSRDHATGASAGNLKELADELRSCDAAVIRHHAWHGDLSQWAAAVLLDADVAGAFKDAEDAIRATPHADAELVREQLLAVLADRYRL